jgi:hypothetical protein
MVPSDIGEFETEGEKAFYKFLEAVAKPVGFGGLLRERVRSCNHIFTKQGLGLLSPPLPPSLGFLVLGNRIKS